MKKKILCLLGLSLSILLTGCQKEPENNYLGNLSLSYQLIANDKKVDEETLGFYYGYSLTKYINEYYASFDDDYTSMLPFSIDENINDLQDQTCTMEGFTDESWEYYFAYKAMETYQEVEALTTAAIDDGYEITEEDKDVAGQAYTSIENYCNENSIEINDYLHSTFGVKSTKDSIINQYANIQMAGRYSETLLQEPSDEEIEEYYNNNKDKLDTVTIRYFAFDKAEQEKAEAFASQVTSQEDFQELVIRHSTGTRQQNFQENDASLRENLRQADLPEYLQDVLFNSGIEEGSVSVIEGTNSYDVVMFIAREKPTYQQVNVASIYLDARESNSDTLTTENMATCKEFADNLLNDFLTETDGSLEQFHQYNKRYSDDKTNQGEYDQVSKGDSTKEIENWIFDASREYGDTAVLTSTYGYTIMFFKERGEIEYYQRAKELVSEEKYDNTLETLKKKIVVSLK